jgi:ATP-dependent Clp protease, protease subunit
LAAHIYIYGDIDSFEDEFAGDWGFVNLKEVKNQLEAQKDETEIVVHIHSYGGDVATGFAIHDLLRAQNKPVTTQNEGMCASIATIIFLAGDKRVMAQNSEFFIHNPWTAWVGGESKDLKQYADQLEVLEEKIAAMYASKSNLSNEDIRSFMNAGKAFTAKEAQEIGFANAAPDQMSAIAKKFNYGKFKAVARFKPDNKMSKEAITKEEAEGIFAKFEKSVKALFGSDETKALKMTSADGTEIDFFELKEGDKVESGVKAKVDSKNAKGDFVMPSGETYKFEDGKLNAIVPVENAEVKALKAEVEQLKAFKAENEKLTAKLTANENAITTMKAEFTTLKASISGVFEDESKREGGSAGESGESGKPQSRKLFKEKEG